MLAETFSDEGTGGIGEGEDGDGWEVGGEISISEAEDDGNADGEEEFAEREAFYGVKDLAEGGFEPTDGEEERDGDEGEEIDLRGGGKDPREGEAEDAHDEMDRFAFEFRGGHLWLGVREDFFDDEARVEEGAVLKEEGL